MTGLPCTTTHAACRHLQCRFQLLRMRVIEIYPSGYLNGTL
jgi:hypothetical protein